MQIAIRSIVSRQNVTLQFESWGKCQFIHYSAAGSDSDSVSGVAPRTLVLIGFGNLSIIQKVTDSGDDVNVVVIVVAVVPVVVVIVVVVVVVIAVAVIVVAVVVVVVVVPVVVVVIVVIVVVVLVIIVVVVVVNIVDAKKISGRIIGNRNK